jgi:hypothetical protein
MMILVHVHELSEKTHGSFVITAGSETQGGMIQSFFFGGAFIVVIDNRLWLILLLRITTSNQESTKRLHVFNFFQKNAIYSLHWFFFFCVILSPPECQQYKSHDTKNS